MGELDNLPTYELRLAAEAEAKTFVLPNDWQKGRELLHGFAIDQPYSQDIDDAISCETSEQSATLRVSIADTGTFLSSYIAVSRLARRRAWTIYRDTRAVAPMLPRAISEDKLSLLHEQPRPVLTLHIPIDATGKVGEPDLTRDICSAQRLSPTEAGEILTRKEGTTALALRHLEQLACQLFVARHNHELSPQEITLEDEEGNLLSSPPGQGIGELIVQETMIAANTAIARFMYKQRIPALYRNHIVPEDMLPEITDPSQRALLRSLAPAFYSPHPQGHAALGIPLYMHFTSPLRRFADFANHANLIAWLEEQELPYPEDRLERIATRMGALALKERDTERSARSYRRGETASPVISPYRKTSYLLEKIASGSAGPGDIAYALFAAVGNQEEVMATKEAAAAFIAANIHHARPTFGVAFSRHLLRLHTATDSEAATHGHTLVIETQDGSTFPYPTSRNPLKNALAHTALIARIAGIEVTPAIPHRYHKYTPEGRAMRQPINYLRRLQQEERAHLAIQKCVDPNGGNYVGLRLTINDNTHCEGAVAPSHDEALYMASTALINRLDLTNNPPPNPKERQQAISKAANSKAAQHANPIAALNARQTTAGGAPATYDLSGDSQDGEFTCIAHAIDIDGIHYEARGQGKNKKSAKEAAANSLLIRMPPRPLNKKGDMYTPKILDNE